MIWQVESTTKYLMEGYLHNSSDCLPFYLLPSGHGARFNKAAVVSLTFFMDGFLVDKGRFRPYTETASQVFLKDLSDGFFPGEMQVRLHLHI